MKATSSAHPRAIPRRGRLMVSASRSAKLRRFASLLNVRPTEFLDWILSDYVKSLGNPNSGLLLEWSDETMVYATAEEEVRTKAAVRAWLNAAELKGGQEP